MTKFIKVTHKIEWEDNILIFTFRRWIYSDEGDFTGSLYDYYRSKNWIDENQSDKYCNPYKCIRKIGGSSETYYSSDNNYNDYIPLSCIKYTKTVEEASPTWEEMQDAPSYEIKERWPECHCIIVRSFEPGGEWISEKKFKYTYPWKRVGRRSYLWVVPFDDRDKDRGRRIATRDDFYPTRKEAINALYKNNK
jgi:hypothetical protein